MSLRAFRDDAEIGKRLDMIPKNERSTIIRMALRQYFGITTTKPELTPSDAQTIARELVQSLKRS